MCFNYKLATVVSVRLLSFSFLESIPFIVRKYLHGKRVLVSARVPTAGFIYHFTRLTPDLCDALSRSVRRFIKRSHRSLLLHAFRPKLTDKKVKLYFSNYFSFKTCKKKKMYSTTQLVFLGKTTSVTRSIRSGSQNRICYLRHNRVRIACNSEI